MAYESEMADADLRSWLDAGLAAHQSGDLERALSAYRQVLSVAPEHGPALTLTGTALLQLGETAEAVTFLEHAARRERADANVLGNLAQAYLAVRRFGDAAESFRKASRIAPTVPQYQAGLAAALALGGKLGEAERLLSRLTTRFPSSALVWLNMGHVFRDTQRPEQAIGAYRKALALDAALIDAHLSLGSVLHSSLRFDEARAEYQACIDVAPDHLAARMNLVSLEMASGRFPDAETACRDIVLLAPERSDAHRLMGTTLAHQQRLSDALEWYERAVNLAPDDAAAARTYGGALMELGDAAKGLRWIARALALEPDSVRTHRVLSGTLLACGRLQDGWIHYVHRPGAAEARTAHKASQPADVAKSAAQSRVCVIGEQGLGDELFFMRYVPRLVATGSRVTVRCDPRLAPLLRRVDAFPEIVDATSAVQDTDVRILCGDLPLALGAQPRSELPRASRDPRPALTDYAQCVRVYWPSPEPSLVIPALTDRRARILERLASLGPPPYVAITWRGGVAPEDQQGADAVLFKSVDPEILAAALVAIRGTVIAIQRNPKTGEIERASEALGRSVHDLTALNDDLESMLALLAIVDEYIGVSNTNMHLRAAACRTARVLVPVPAEWRWMRSGKTSPWFPGFSIYRQSPDGDWTSALNAMKADLEVN